jgi:hypothetical protein
VTRQAHDSMTEDHTNQAKRLAELAMIIDSHADWWRFPEEPPIRGFLGTDPLFIVGDQPSTSSWDSAHPNRRAFYGLLQRLRASNAHLTDLYKRRGRSGALKAGLPSDFGIHLKFFREELAVIRPTRVVALGQHAYDLLASHVPEVRPILDQIWHFAYPVRYGRVAEWEAKARVVLLGASAAFSVNSRRVGAPPSQSPATSHFRNQTGTPRPRTQRAVMRDLFLEYGGDTERIISAYANAERNGQALRSRNSSDLRPEQYARALLSDGLKKGWL